MTKKVWFPSIVSEASALINDVFYKVDFRSLESILQSDRCEKLTPPPVGLTAQMNRWTTVRIWKYSSRLKIPLKYFRAGFHSLSDSLHVLKIL
jgi:hypothetical protein